MAQGREATSSRPGSGAMHRWGTSCPALRTTTKGKHATLGLLQPHPLYIRMEGRVDLHGRARPRWVDTGKRGLASFPVSSPA